MSQVFLFLIGPPSAPEGPMQFSDITASSCYSTLDHTKV